MTTASRHTPFRAVALATLFASVLATGPAYALYKVVGPDGKVTYTDRPAAAATGNKVQPVQASPAAGGGTDLSSLPFELRQTVQRYPVTLYTASGCGPCDTARQLLRQRGVPFAERTINNADDGAALQRITGKADLPAATIGSQVLTGLNSADWTNYLDVAGYPKASQLPASYVERAATPLTTPAAAPAVPTARRNAPSGDTSPSPAPAPSTNPPGFKF